MNITKEKVNPSVSTIELHQRRSSAQLKVPTGAEDVEVAGQHQVLVLVAGEAAALEVHNMGVCREEISPEDGLLYLGDLEVPDEAENCRAIILEP